MEYSAIEIHEMAKQEAVMYASEWEQEHGEMAYCGFAWVTIFDGRSKFTKELVKAGVARKSWDGTYTIWNPSEHPTQSMDTKEAGAEAYARVLKAFGVKAYAESRPD